MYMCPVNVLYMYCIACNFEVVKFLGKILVYSEF